MFIFFINSSNQKVAFRLWSTNNSADQISNFDNQSPCLFLFRLLKSFKAILFGKMNFIYLFFKTFSDVILMI